MKPLAWSFSSLEMFETCPWRWNLTKHAKLVKEPLQAHQQEGTVAHKALEKYLTELQPLPEQYKKIQPVLDHIRKSGGKVEAETKVALTPQFTETTFFGKDVWVRAVFDVRVRLPGKTILLDWKLGKPKLGQDQLRLAAAVELKLRPTVPVVEAGYVWLKHGYLDRLRVTQQEAPGIWGEFMPRVARIEHAIKTNNFPKKPSGLCRQWCPVGKKHCEHCGTD